MTGTDSVGRWADGPFKLLSTPRAALKGAPESKASVNVSEMALLHNVIFRGLNCIYLQAPNIKYQEDIMDFLTFCDAWSYTLRSHHNTEETVYFPLVEEQSTRKGVMAQNHAEHEAFLPGLAAFDKFVTDVKASPESYNGLRLVELIDDFGPVLETHLRNEITLLSSLEKDEQMDWDLLGKTISQHSKKVADRVREVPFLITNSDVTYESGIHGVRFPPFPWLIGVLFRWVYVPQLKGAWRFSSCDDYGIPKDLPFA